MASYNQGICSTPRMTVCYPDRAFVTGPCATIFRADLAA
jgi:hypothetical protein